MPPVALSGACRLTCPPANPFVCSRRLDLRPRLRRAGLAVAVGPRHHPRDAESSAFPNLSFLARSLAQGQFPFWTPERLRRMAADRRPPVADLFPSAFCARAVRCNAELCRGRCGGVCAAVYRRARRHPDLPRARLARGRRAGRSACLRVRRSNASRIQHIGQIESICWLPFALSC